MDNAHRRRIRRHGEREPVVAVRIEKVPSLLPQHRERKRLFVRQLDFPQTAKPLNELHAVLRVLPRPRFREIRKLLDRKTELEAQIQAPLLEEFPVVLLGIGENAGAARVGDRDRGRPLSPGRVRDGDSQRDEKDQSGGGGLHRSQSVARNPGMMTFENPNAPRSVPKKNSPGQTSSIAGAGTSFRQGDFDSAGSRSLHGETARPPPSTPDRKCPMSELGDNCSASREKVQPGLLRIRAA